MGEWVLDKAGLAKVLERYDLLILFRKKGWKRTLKSWKWEINRCDTLHATSRFTKLGSWTSKPLTLDQRSLTPHPWTTWSMICQFCIRIQFLDCYFRKYIHILGESPSRADQSEAMDNFVVCFDSSSKQMSILPQNR